MTSAAIRRVSENMIVFEQRPLLRPWRVEAITQVWDGRKWVVTHRRLVRRGR